MTATPNRARDLFVAAVKLPPEQWDRFLAEHCADDEALRRRVQDLLTAHKEAGSFLEPAAGLLVTTGEPLAEQPGTVIGPYKLVEPIGEGGFGVVFLAEQAQPVRRKVALKVLKPGMDTRHVLARFEAERQALALMDHPNIAKVFDGGVTASGRPYFVMELVTGVPITEFCDQNRLTPRQRLELFLPVCSAVQHAHQKGIIHRDIKPSNVLVSRHDTTPVVKVIDFGVAKALGQELTDKTLLTDIAQMVGTPLYMSPEQAGMSDLDVDTRSDIYSLGVMLYELLTGTTPFDKERLRAAGHDEMRRIIREEEPPKPSTRLSMLGTTTGTVSANRGSEPRRLTGLVRGELDWIVMKALEKDRDRRYETVGAFAADVQRYLADEPVQACPPSKWYRLRKFARRNRGVVVAVSGIVVVLAAGVIGTTLGLIRSISHEKRAEDAGILAKGRAQELRRHLYGAQTNQAWQAWHLGDLRQTKDLLERQRPLAADDEDLRGFEWYCLRRLCREADTPKMVLQGHTAASYGLAFSPDGRLLATTGADGMAYLWEVATGKRIHSLPGVAGEQNCAVFHPKGEVLVTTSDDGFVWAWDVAAGKRRQFVIKLPVQVMQASFSPDGRQLAITSWDGHVRVYAFPETDEPAGPEIRLLANAHPPRAQGVAFSPDGKVLATCGKDSTIKLWNMATGEMAHRIPGGSAHTHIAWEHQQSVFATAGYDGMVRVWYVSTGTIRNELRHGSVVRSLAFSPDDRVLVTSDGSGNVRLWEVGTGRLLHAFPAHSGAVWSVRFSPDGRQLASTAQDGSAKVWDVSSLLNLRQLGIGPHTVMDLAFSPDSAALALVSRDGTCHLVRRSDGVNLASVKGPDLAGQLTYAADGRSILIAFENGHVMRWRPTESKLHKLALTGPAAPAHLSQTPDGRHILMSCNKDGMMHLWEADTGRRVRRFAFDDTATIFQFAMAPDGSRFAAASWPGRVGLFDIHHEYPRRSIPNGHQPGALAMSPDGKLVAIGRNDGSIACWDCDSELSPRLLVGSVGRSVSSLAFSPDGRTIAAGGANGEVKLWHVVTGQELGTLSLGGSDHGGHMKMRFSPDGRMLAVTYDSGRGGECWFWRAPREEN